MNLELQVSSNQGFRRTREHVQSFMNSVSRICGMVDPIDSEAAYPTNNVQPTDPYLFMRKIQQSFCQHPSLRETITNPKDAEQQRASQAFRKLVREQVGQYLFENHFQELLSNGHFSVVRLKKMHHIDCYSNPTDNYSRFFDDLSKISEEERSKLLSDQKYFGIMFNFLNPSNKSIARNVLSQREFRFEDKLRAARDDRPVLRTLMSQIDSESLQLIREEYQRKYHCSVDELAG